LQGKERGRFNKKMKGRPGGFANSLSLTKGEGQNRASARKGGRINLAKVDREERVREKRAPGRKRSGGILRMGEYPWGFLSPTGIGLISPKISSWVGT